MSICILPPPPTPPRQWGRMGDRPDTHTPLGLQHNLRTLAACWHMASEVPPLTQGGRALEVENFRH